MQTDAALIDQVISGDDDAFDELYRRHASAAWRLGQSVTGTAPETADAVSEAYARVFQALRAGRLDRAGDLRSYLLAATRIVALDGGGKGPVASDELPEQDEAALVARSFRALPERWRSILWLTEVEGVAIEDAAKLLGLSSGAAAQLAGRARAGLRERFLQAHARGTNAAGCRFTVDRLAAHAGGDLSRRDTSKVDEHLAGCADCTDRKAGLDDLGATLRRTALAMPLGLRDRSCSAVKAAMAAPLAPGPTVFPAGPGATARALAWSRTPPTWFQKAVAASSAAVLAVGVVSIGFHDVEDETTEAASDPIGPAESTTSGPVKIDLAGSVAPALTSAGAVGTALRDVDIPPARPSSDTAAEPSDGAAPA
ncbi:MAG: sigma-70 family RNA polymerase sigma factor, partial [Acidimicrobiales bacterium]